MSLRLFNTLTKTKDDFSPIDAKNVRMYVCGPTVYDFAHIGNARPVIVFDVLFRLLRHIYGAAHVTYVRNITDVDDKINERAAQRGVSIRELTEGTARIYEEDMAMLGNLPPSVTPRATEHIAQMIAMIQQLILAGHAYEAEGHVLFNVSSKGDYGKLSRRSVDEMLAGARVEVAPYKQNAMDFVLWKPSDANVPGWDSPWGRGRPGWHIECSAMAGEYLGQTFDIHGGGIDLQFPHHENEIAQSEGAHHGAPLAKVWMHNGFLQVEGEKMSKSAGNFFTVRDLLNTEKFGGSEWSGQTLRLNMLRTHYRQPINWTASSLASADAATYRWYVKADEVTSTVLSKTSHRKLRVHPAVRAALFDDLNTPLALSEIYKIEDAMTAAYDSDNAEFEKQAEFFLTSLSLLGLYNLDEEMTALSRRKKDSARLVLVQEVEPLIEARNAARKAKNFAESDRIRDELLAKGVLLKDGPQGTTWEVKK